jgi:hypothetical protein
VCWPDEKDRFAGYRTDDEPPELAFYCEMCAERALGLSSRGRGRVTEFALPAPPKGLRVGAAVQTPCRLGRIPFL